MKLHTFFTSLHRYRMELRFLATFLVCYGIGIGAYNLTSDSTSAIVVDKLNAGVSIWIINTITPAEHAVAKGATIVSGEKRVNIKKGCEGIEGILLLCSAIIAFSAPWMLKIRGIIFGTALLYGANIVRTITLYYIFIHTPAYFNLFHVFIGQTFIILLGIIYFILWTSRIHTDTRHE